MLAALLGRVVLRPEKEGLWAELRPDLWVLLHEHVDSNGAGRPALRLPTDVYRLPVTESPSRAARLASNP